MYRLFPLLLSLFFLFPMISHAKILGTDKVDNGFVFDPEDPKKIDISVVDLAEANKLFKEFASNKDLAFQYPVEGCFARATVMGQMAEKKGIYVGRLYAEGLLQVSTHMVDNPLLQWRHHIAPVLFVKQPNGKSVLQVFDPALFSKPVSIDEWKAKLLFKTKDIKPSIERTYFGSRFQYATRSRGSNDQRALTDTFYKGEWIFKDLNDPETGAYAVLKDNRRKIDDDFMQANPKPSLDDAEDSSRQ